MTSPADPPGKPLRRDAERNRQLILEAARGLFAERGPTVTLDDIAARAGVGVGTVYRRFPSRDDLLDTLFEDRVDELLANAKRALALDDPWASVEQLLKGYMEIQGGDRSFGPVVLTNAHGRGGLDRARVQLKPVVDQIVERAQQAGVLRADVTTTDFPMIILSVALLQNASRDVAPDAWRRQLAIILDGLRAHRTDTLPLTADPVDQADVPRIMHDGFAPHARRDG